MAAGVDHGSAKREDAAVKRRSKQVVGAGVAVAGLLGGGAIVLGDELVICHRLTQGAASFSDPLPEAHESTIDCLAYYDVVVGNADGTFGADQLVTRGQAAAMLGRAALKAGIEAPPVLEDDDLFDDDEGHAHEASINGVADYGIMLGTADGKADPNGRLTRGQAASMAIRAVRVATDWVPAEGVPDAFTDDDGSVHEDAIDQAAALGILQGTAPGEVQPNATLTRGQAATLMANVMNMIVEESMR